MRRINDRLLSWASILDPATETQAKLTATMPFIHPHVALMPDAHLGLGATVGSVLPTERAVMPESSRLRRELEAAARLARQRQPLHRGLTG